MQEVKYAIRNIQFPHQSQCLPHVSRLSSCHSTEPLATEEFSFPSSIFPTLVDTMLKGLRSSNFCMCILVANGFRSLMCSPSQAAHFHSSLCAGVSRALRQERYLTLCDAVSCSYQNSELIHDLSPFQEVQCLPAFPFLKHEKSVMATLIYSATSLLR